MKKINCTQIRPLLWLYLDNGLPDKQIRWVENHLPTCPECKSYLAKLTQVRKILSNTTVQPLPLGFYTRLYQRVEDYDSSRKFVWRVPVSYLRWGLAFTLLLISGWFLCDKYILLNKTGVPEKEFAAPTGKISSDKSVKPVTCLPRPEISTAKKGSETAKKEYTSDTRRVKILPDLSRPTYPARSIDKRRELAGDIKGVENIISSPVCGKEPEFIPEVKPNDSNTDEIAQIPSLPINTKSVDLEVNQSVNLPVTDGVNKTLSEFDKPVEKFIVSTSSFVHITNPQLNEEEPLVRELVARGVPEQTAEKSVKTITSRESDLSTSVKAAVTEKVQVVPPSGKTSTIRAALPIGNMTSSGFKLNKVYPIPFTPNGDNVNETVIFDYQNPDKVKIEIIIYDINGSEVKRIFPPEHQPGTVWDGTNESGTVVETGVYIYKLIAVGNKPIKGVIVLAK